MSHHSDQNEMSHHCLCLHAQSNVACFRVCLFCLIILIRMRCLIISRSQVTRASICVLQCVAVCCSVLQCVAVCCSSFPEMSHHIEKSSHTCEVSAGNTMCARVFPALIAPTINHTHRNHKHAVLSCAYTRVVTMVVPTRIE